MYGYATVDDAPPPPPERFYTNELSFVRPQNLKDKTFHVFTMTDIGPSPFSSVVGRSPAAPDVDLETLAQQLPGELKKSLSHVEWIEPVTPVEVAGLDARRVEFRWRQQGQPVHQLQLIFMHHDEHLQPLLMHRRLGCAGDRRNDRCGCCYWCWYRATDWTLVICLP
ncbi:DUF1795 domain-containing protein [Pseudomonas tussilaginis]|nr:DUF1795 domain-containing protein [Pseudomonas sp. S11A 273]